VQYNQQVYPVTYTYCTSTGKVTQNYINSKIISFSERILAYVRELRLTPRSCRQENLLEIYEVPLSVLNDPDRFTRWQEYNPGVYQIWGLYDSRDNEPGLSAIIITDQYSWQDINFGHELAHYWQDRLCLTSDYNSNEDFAEGFERKISYSR